MRIQFLRHLCEAHATDEGVKDILATEKKFKAAGVTPCWYVDAESLEGYRALGLDAKVGGKLIPARNMALDDSERLGKACVQVSDDIEKLLYIRPQGGWTRKLKLREANAVAKVASRYQVSPVATARFLLAKIRGAASCAPDSAQANWVPTTMSPKLGGILPHSNTGIALEAWPYGYDSFILGDFFVSEKSPCRFDTRMTLKEDYDLTCAHLHTHGSVVRFNHIMIHAKHETNAGGACTVRDSQGERERENIRILREKWPGAFADNPDRPNQVKMKWKGHLKWKRETSAKAKGTDEVRGAPDE